MTNLSNGLYTRAQRTGLKTGLYKKRRTGLLRRRAGQISIGLGKMSTGDHTTSSVVGRERLHKDSRKSWSERGATARKDRRRPGVTRRSAERKNKNSLKILLTEIGARTILPLRQQLPSQRTFQRSSPIRTPEKPSARSTGVRTIRKRDEFVRNGSGSHSL